MEEIKDILLNMQGSIIELIKGQDKMQLDIVELQQGQEELRADVKELQHGQKKLQTEQRNMRTEQCKLNTLIYPKENSGYLRIHENCIFRYSLFSCLRE